MMSIDACVSFRPAATFRALATEPVPSSRWVMWRRPLAFALVMGAMVSLAITGSLNARLLLSGALAWCFIPVIETVALAIVLRRSSPWPFGRSVDAFFAGFGIWCLFFVGIAAVPAVPLRFSQVALFGWLEYAGSAIIFWSLYVDYCFFRYAIGRKPSQARADLLRHRLLTWIPILLIIGAPGLLGTAQELLSWRR
jgi:hypothetical protein